MDRTPAPLGRPGPRAWLPVATALLALLSATAVVTRHIGDLVERMDRAESLRARQESEVGARLEGVRSELDGVRREIGRALEDLGQSEELARRLDDAELHLGSLGASVEAQASSLQVLEQTQSSLAPGIEREIEERDERLLQRYEALSELAESARRSATDSQVKLAELDRALATPPDLQRMWRELVGPVVQLAGDASVGSGVLLPSERRPDGAYGTFVLTAWHVVRDIQGDPPDLSLPVPVQIYREDGSIRREHAKLLRHDPKLDAALLEITTEDALEFGARLASREELERATIFEPVVAVGCPLGNDPIPTRGEIATCQHEVDGERYWMINAPTYIGNSGGGIFDSETHELLGIFSKIYTHGSLRPTIVPHMGLVTPLTKIYDWLGQVGYANLVPAEGRADEAAHTGR